MTYRELFYKATRLIDKGKITLGEYDEMTKPLDREIEQEPCERFEWSIDGNVYKITKAKDGKEICQQVCNDAISRQAALASIKYLYRDMPILNIMDTRRKWLEKYAPYFECENAIEHLPSVTLQQKYGKWIAQDIHNCHTEFKCSKCGYIHNFMHLYGKPSADYTYCPNCGAKMESEDKE